MTMMLVNLPVTDLERAKAFYTAIGFTINPAFTDHNAACSSSRKTTARSCSSRASSSRLLRAADR